MTDARKLLEPVVDDMVRLAAELVRTDTTAIPPEGKETPGQFVLRDFLGAYGVEAELYAIDFVRDSGHRWARQDRNYAGRMNLAARIPGTGRGRSLLLNGHMDTVPEGSGRWTDSPWSGAIRDGRLYGRGSFDMKGGLAANFAVACALRRAGVRLGGDLICESVVDEEWGGGGGTLAARLRGDRADACAISEGTQLEINLATRGGHTVDLVCSAGDPSRFFSTAEVVSPAMHIGRLLGWLEGWVAHRRTIDRGSAYAAFDDPAPVQVMAIEANRLDLRDPLTVPLTATIRAYFQFLPHEDVDAVLKDIRRSLDAFCDGDPFFRMHRPEWKDLYYPPLIGHELPPDHPWAACLTSSARAALGREPVVGAARYPCDAFLAHREFGIPTLLFGPRGAGAHNPDE
ncbi:MAG TPA: M20/M25/M40 family metallo-hydrolase [Bryobacteraceae bacterium]|nr:M20/M25/M40 family metallo-hydrolase [Bryobacteraceae bacterium]